MLATPGEGGGPAESQGRTEIEAETMAGSRGALGQQKQVPYFE